jgi:F0F1-type ATP synthase assembly protein I
MLRLKEKPIEWIKFTAVIGLVVNIILWLLWRRDVLSFMVPSVAAALAILCVITAVIRPRWFRGFYRGGMTISFQFGQIIGKILLTLFFFLFVTPLGLLLRVLGKDLLLTKKNPGIKTYWHPAKNNREFDRMF